MTKHQEEEYKDGVNMPAAENKGQNGSYFNTKTCAWVFALEFYLYYFDIKISQWHVQLCLLKMMFLRN